MNSPASKPLQIFKPGRHTAMSGAALEFSESDLAASAAAYDPVLFEAPIVVGHPKTDNPAYGWVKALSFADGALDAEPCQVDPAFAEIVSAGRYKKISAAFYAPDAKNNPVPGVYYLRHVGFLGAAAPAVKGLRAPEFSDTEEGIVEFSEWDDVTVAQLFRSMREWFIGKFGQDEADRVIPGYQVQSLEQSAQRELEKPSSDSAAIAAPLFSDPDPLTKETSLVTPEQKAALEAENVQLKARLATADAREAEAKRTVIHTGNVAFAEGLITTGHLLPAQKDIAVATLDHFENADTVLEFGEGEAKQPLAAAFKTFLSGLPKQVEFGEVARAGVTGTTSDPTTIAALAVEFQESEAAAGRTIHIATAVAHVSANPGAK